MTLAVLLLSDIFRDRPKGVGACPIDVAAAVLAAALAWIPALLLMEAKAGAETRKAIDARAATVVVTGGRMMTPTLLSGDIARHGAAPVEVLPTDIAVALAGALAQTSALLQIGADAGAATVIKRDTRAATVEDIPAKAPH